MNESNADNAINFPVIVCLCLILWWIMTLYIVKKLLIMMDENDTLEFFNHWEF